MYRKVVSLVCTCYSVFVLLLLSPTLAVSQEVASVRPSVAYSNANDKKIYQLESPDKSLMVKIEPYGGNSKHVEINGSWNRSHQNIAIDDHAAQFKIFDFVLGTYTDLITTSERPGYKITQESSSAIDMTAYAIVDGSKILLNRSLTLHNDGQVLEAISLSNEGKTPVVLDFEGLAFSFGSLFDFSRASSNNSNIPEFQYYDGKKLSKVNIHGGNIFSGPKTMEFLAKPKWFTVADNFFLAIVDPHTDGAVIVYNGLSFGPKYRVSTGVQVLATTLLPNQHLVVSLDYYIGPRHEAIVKDINRDFTKLFRWPSIFNWVIKPIELSTTWLITLLIDSTGSVGLTLILIAILVKLLLLPMSIKSAISMKKMRLLQPKLNKLQDKYGHDPQILQQKTMELYKTEKVNPLGGCLPLLMQIPVFFALFRVLSRSIELRGAGFLWIKDLTMSDALFTIGTFDVNFLPILMTVLQIISVYLQQGRMGSSQNNMQQQMQKQSYFMPLIFLFLFWRMPSGLVLYWTIQNIFSIAEQEVINLDSRFTQKKI